MSDTEDYEFAEAVAEAVAAAPPLTDEQRDRIAAILRGRRDTTEPSGS